MLHSAKNNLRENSLAIVSINMVASFCFSWCIRGRLMNVSDCVEFAALQLLHLFCIQGHNMACESGTTRSTSGNEHPFYTLLILQVPVVVDREELRLMHVLHTLH
jgi:hypothetical protein